MAKRRTAAQQRATRKMIAANRARARGRRAPSKSRRRPARRRNPTTPVAAKRRSFRTARNLSNPTRRRRRRVSASPTRRRVRRRRNPIGNRIINDLVMPSVTGAAGAVLVDVVMGYVPLPAMLQTNAYVRAGVKGLAAVGLAMVADQTKLVSRRTAQQLGVGSLTVTMATLARDLIGQVAPNLQLDGLGYYSSAVPAGVPQPMDSLGLYVRGGGSGQLPNASREVGVQGATLGMYDDEMTEQGYAY